MIFNSIRWRLQAWHGLILVAVLAGFGFTAYQVARDNQLRRIDQDLDQRLMALLRPRPPDRPTDRSPDWQSGRPDQRPEPAPGELRNERRFGFPDFGQRVRELVQQGGVLDSDRLISSTMSCGSRMTRSWPARRARQPMCLFPNMPRLPGRRRFRAATLLEDPFPLDLGHPCSPPCGPAAN